MQKRIFKDEFKPITAKRKKELDALVKKVHAANKDPDFKKYVSELHKYHLGLK